MESLLLFSILIACILIICLLFILYSYMKQYRFDKIEKGIQINNKELIESKSFQGHLTKNYELLLKEMIKTKEYLGVSDAKLNLLTQNIKNMNDIMVNHKRRGNFGEYQLQYLLSLYLGESDSLYESQYHLSNGKIGDVALHLPNQSLVLIIDSKFPSENYLKLIKEEDNKYYQSEFKNNIKKHIHDISRKYIVKNETLEEAIMFIPSEAIYMYICEEMPEMIEEAFKKHVLMTSPSTLLGVSMTLANITKDFNRAKNIEKMEKMIISLEEDSGRMVERYQKARKTIETLTHQMDELNISMNKIHHRIDDIYNGKDI